MPAVRESAPSLPAVSQARTAVYMDTLVTIEVVEPAPDDVAARIEAAFGWFARVEAVCSRFDPESDLSQLCRQPGVEVRVDPLLYRAIEFALSVARASGGAFDPTVGRTLAAQGFDTNYRTGERTVSEAAATGGLDDVVLDASARTVLLRRPLTLDLGAVAKGFAIDLAAHELRGCPNFAINAGGDLYLAGNNPDGEPWRIGIRHPRIPEAILTEVAVSGVAVCTSGDYDRPRPDGQPGHHIVEPRSGRSASGVASVTVIALTAMLADALGTAAFVLGPERGIAFLEAQGVDGLIISADLAQHATSEFHRRLV